MHINETHPSIWNIRREREKGNSHRACPRVYTAVDGEVGSCGAFWWLRGVAGVTSLRHQAPAASWEEKGDRVRPRHESYLAMGARGYAYTQRGDSGWSCVEEMMFKCAEKGRRRKWDGGLGCACQGWGGEEARLSFIEIGEREREYVRER